MFWYEVLKSEAFQITLSEICSANAGPMKPVVEMQTSKNTEIYNVETVFLKVKISCYFPPHRRKHKYVTNFYYVNIHTNYPD